MPHWILQLRQVLHDLRGIFILGCYLENLLREEGCSGSNQITAKKDSLGLTVDIREKASG